ncbi:MAG TPA: glycosyltransferase family 39 protein [Candidatus Eisenbacteria bacterium]|jgi:hypothetical protein
MTGEEPHRRRALILGLAAALALRAALAARAPIIEVDGAYWAGLAAALERGDLRHGFSTAWPPLYPALVAAFARIARMAGTELEPAALEACARGASVLAGTLLLVPLFLIARRLLSPRAATVAVLLAAVHPRLLQYSAAALSEATYTLLLALALALLVAREQEPGSGAAREALAGALFGLGYLVRPEALALAAAIWTAGLFRRPRDADAQSPGRALASRLRPAFAIATIAVALPWLLFLHGALGRWSLGEKGEYNYWRAYQAEYAAVFPAPAGLAARVNESPELALAPARDGVRAIEFTLRRPAVVLGRSARNLGTIVASTLPVTLYWPLVPLAVLALAGPWRRGAWPVAVAVGAMPILYAPFSADRRFLVPAVAFLLVACAAGIERVESWLAGAPAGAARARRGVDAALALLAALSVAYAWRNVGSERAPEHRRAGEWLRSGWRADTAPAQRSAGARPVVMSRKPWVAFYAGGLIAELPDAPPESLAALARRRGAVLVADQRSAETSRPQLGSLLDPARAPAGLAVLHREDGPPPLVLYRPAP